MTEPTAQRAVPGPPRPGPVPTGPAAPEGGADPAGEPAEGSAAPAPAPDRLAELDELPVAEHVAVFEAEHERLQRELGTIDPR